MKFKTQNEHGYICSLRIIFTVNEGPSIKTIHPNTQTSQLFDSSSSCTLFNKRMMSLKQIFAFGQNPSHATLPAYVLYGCHLNIVVCFKL